MARDEIESGGFLAHWRFNLFLLLLVLGTPAGVVLGFQPARAFLATFDIAALIFIGTAVQLMLGRAERDIRRQAAYADANRLLLLTITCVLAAVVLAALVVELGGKKNDGWGPGLAIATLAISWLFTSFVYALHYAHLYYGRDDDGKGDAGGLDFPGDEHPDYWDFLYFSIVLGSTFQVSDVEISSREIRRIATIHGLVAFFFNIGVVALTINVVGSAL